MDMGDYETAVGRADQPGELWKLVTGFFHGTSVERILYHHLPPLGARDAGSVEVASFGFPEAMVETYVQEKLYRRNPMLQHGLSTIEPFYLDTVALPDDLTPSQAAFFQAVWDFSFDHGLGVQVFGPNGRNGYCGLGFTRGVTRLDPVDVRNYQWVCQLAHLRYCTVILPTLGPPPQLSGRETEVLSWVARGKSNSSIGDILGISAHTVDAHLRRIYLKLGVVDRISAAVRGIGVGLIHAST